MDAGLCSAPGSRPDHRTPHLGHRTPGTAAVPGSPRHHTQWKRISEVIVGVLGDVFREIRRSRLSWHNHHSSIPYSFVIGVSLLMFQWVNVCLVLVHFFGKFCSFITSPAPHQIRLWWYLEGRQGSGLKMYLLILMNYEYWRVKRKVDSRLYCHCSHFILLHLFALHNMRGNQYLIRKVFILYY